MTGLSSGSIQLTWGVVMKKAFDQSVEVSTAFSKVLNDPTFVFGTSGSRAVNLLYWKTTALAAAAVTVNMFGVLEDVFGDVISPAFVKAIAIINDSTTPGHTLSFGNAASNQFVAPFGAATHIVKCGPQGVIYLSSPIDGYAAATGGSTVKFDPGANTFNVTWAFTGSTA